MVELTPHQNLFNIKTTIADTSFIQTAPIPMPNGKGWYFEWGAEDLGYEFVISKNDPRVDTLLRYADELGKTLPKGQNVSKNVIASLPKEAQGFVSQLSQAEQREAVLAIKLNDVVTNGVTLKDGTHTEGFGEYNPKLGKAGKKLDEFDKKYPFSEMKTILKDDKRYQNCTNDERMLLFKSIKLYSAFIKKVELSDALEDYITKNGTIRPSDLANLIKDETVCRHRAELAMLLMEKAGVNTAAVGGRVAFSNGAGAHLWAVSEETGNVIEFSTVPFNSYGKAIRDKISIDDIAHGHTSAYRGFDDSVAVYSTGYSPKQHDIVVARENGVNKQIDRTDDNRAAEDAYNNKLRIALEAQLYFAKKYPNVNWNVTDPKRDPKNPDWIPQEGLKLQINLPSVSKLANLCRGESKF